MAEEFVILIADRNRHVRELLKRELIAEGYRVLAAENGREVMRMVEGNEPPDLLILDLEVPFLGGTAILERLRSRIPPLPVVIHTFLTEHTNHINGRSNATLVEKSGNTDFLKAAVNDLLREFYPQRFRSEPEGALQEAGAERGSE